MKEAMGDGVQGQKHWTKKGDVNLFLWEKKANRNGGSGADKLGTVLFGFAAEQLDEVVNLKVNCNVPIDPYGNKPPSRPYWRCKGGRRCERRDITYPHSFCP